MAFSNHRRVQGPALGCLLSNGDGKRTIKPKPKVQ